MENVMENDTSNNTLSLDAKLPEKERIEALQVNVKVTIRNATSIAFLSARLAIVDQDTDTAREVVFGMINPQSTDFRDVSMPGGVESIFGGIQYGGGLFLY